MGFRDSGDSKYEKSGVMDWGPGLKSEVGGRTQALWGVFSTPFLVLNFLVFFRRRGGRPLCFAFALYVFFWWLESSFQTERYPPLHPMLFSKMTVYHIARFGGGWAGAWELLKT